MTKLSNRRPSKDVFDPLHVVKSTGQNTPELVGHFVRTTWSPKCPQMVKRCLVAVRGLNTPADTERHSGPDEYGDESLTGSNETCSVSIANYAAEGRFRTRKGKH